MVCDSHRENYEQHRATLSSLLDRAEQLKAGPSNPIPPSATPVAGAPVAVSVTGGAASRVQPRAAELLTLEVSGMMTTTREVTTTTEITTTTEVTTRSPTTTTS